nr:baseplate J/gp47 family protein [uncultured Acetatifactor sp.]
MYEDTTYEVILQRMLGRVPDKFDKREGSLIWDTHSPTAIELQLLYIELDAILREAYGDTASREFLILRCREKGIRPHEATRAVLRGMFVPDGLVAPGERFNIGNVNYVFTGKRAGDEKGGWEVECETPGRIGNQFFGQMIPMEYIKGLQSAELTEILVLGEDEEDTEDLRQRYFAAFDEYAFGGNRADYLKKTNSIPGVGRTKITRVWNGNISPADMVPKESVEEWYNGIIGTLTGEVRDWLSTLFRAAKEKKLTTGGTVLLTIIDSEFGPASDALIQTVQTAIDPEENAGDGYGIAPIGHVVRVESAKAREIAVKTNLAFEDGYGWGNLQSSIEEAVSTYFLELRKEWADASRLIVRVSQIDTRLLGVQGIIDVQGTTLNGERNNLELGEYEVPVLGGVGA